MPVDGESFAFQNVNESKMKKYIGKRGMFKATDIDNLPLKVLRLTSQSLARPITNIVNLMLANGQFPERLKIAGISVFKKR